jgi:hypothetical protein
MSQSGLPALQVTHQLPPSGTGTDSASQIRHFLEYFESSKFYIRYGADPNRKE